jgi:hypothetical protein
VAKTKLRVFFWTLIHLCLALVGFFMIYFSIQAVHEFRDNPSLCLLAALAGLGPILFIGVVYPAMHLYAMHRLLAMLKAQDNAASPGELRKLKE